MIVATKPDDDPMGVWTPCICGEFWCRIHRQHVHECACPPIDEWAVDPYSTNVRSVKEIPLLTGRKKMGRSVADVTTLVYVPRTKRWEAQSMDCPGVRADGDTAVAALMRLTEGIYGTMVGEPEASGVYVDEVKKLDAWLKTEKKRLGLPSRG